MLGSKADVIGLHPMFGPTVKSIRNQTIIVCPARAKEARVTHLSGIFEARGRGLHDRDPGGARPDGGSGPGAHPLCHALHGGHGAQARRGPPHDRAFKSPVYQIELSLVGRLLSQDPALYADILQQNPFVPEVLAACR